MNMFDTAAVACVNEFARHSWLFDKLLYFLSGNYLLKGGCLVTILWWAWFKEDGNQSNNRKHVILTLISCFIAIVLARLLALTLPFRLRPLHQEGLDLLLPYGMELTSLDGWSSFPSDHATLFFALSTGILFVSRKLGVFALCYTAIIISFPRIYLCLHYPTDIVAGAIIGITIALLFNVYSVRREYLLSIERWSYSQPSIFYPLFFLLSYQIADMFNSSRAIIMAGYTVFKILFS
jgi:undecaprenyl-diphosphatase